MRKTSTLFLLCLFLSLSTALAACGSEELTESDFSDMEGIENEEETVFTIYTSMYPLYQFAKEIAGDRAEVHNMIPAGAEPHDYEPTANDIMSLSQAELFIYNGGGFESWIEKIIEAVNHDQMIIVDSTASLHLLPNEETGHIHAEDHDQEHGTEEEDHDHGHEHSTEEEGRDHGHGDLDPHVWLDPLLAKQQADAINQALQERDPDHADEYQENFNRLAQRFDQLDEEYRQVSENIERRDFIVSHAAFGYIAHRYGFNQIAISGLNPSDEPSAQQLQEIISFAKENDVQYILFENLVTPKVATVVQEEIEAEALVFHNLEGLTKEELSQGKDYFSIMEENLEVLKKALGYQA